MDEKQPRRISRRGLLRLGAGGAALLAVGTTVALDRFSTDGATASSRAATQPTVIGPAVAPSAIVPVRVAATDGFVLLPERVDGTGSRKPLYVFGFTEVPYTASLASLTALQGNGISPAPYIRVSEGFDTQIMLTNIGFKFRPDLDDSHTIHWHGFRMNDGMNDGVPEVSIAIPAERSFTYNFYPRDPGTYMWHCHFEDTEHVQMGMIGIISVLPSQNEEMGGKFVYNDGDGSTAFDREFALLLSEIDQRPHDKLFNVQEFVWTEYDPQYTVINMRAYPDTLLPTDDPSLPSQPISSRIQMNEGDRGLLRIANLGFQQHSMQFSGIDMHVIGRDATYLGALPSGRMDISYKANILDISPGQSLDVLVTAPPHSGGSGPDVYMFKDRNMDHLTNDGAAGLGGMATEAWIYPAGTLPAQTGPNETITV